MPVSYTHLDVYKRQLLHLSEICQALGATAETRRKSLNLWLILTLPTVNAIRENYPSAKITFLTSKENAALLRGFPEVDEVVTVDHASLRTQSGEKLPRWHSQPAVSEAAGSFCGRRFPSQSDSSGDRPDRSRKLFCGIARKGCVIGKSSRRRRLFPA